MCYYAKCIIFKGSLRNIKGSMRIINIVFVKHYHKCIKKLMFPTQKRHQFQGALTRTEARVPAVAMHECIFNFFSEL